MRARLHAVYRVIKRQAHKQRIVQGLTVAKDQQACGLFFRSGLGAIAYVSTGVETAQRAINTKGEGVAWTDMCCVEIFCSFTHRIMNQTCRE